MHYAKKAENREIVRRFDSKANIKSAKKKASLTIRLKVLEFQRQQQT